MRKLKAMAYCDPSHGWLRVKRKLLLEMGIAGSITPFSYEHGSWVYLEEDSDASNFKRACDALGIVLEIRFVHGNRESKIRSYADYSGYEVSNG